MKITVITASIACTGHLDENDSFFNYSIDATSYSSINNGYLDYVPLFTEDLLDSVSDDVIEACKSDLNCIYDYILTGDKDVGISTYNISLSNDDIIKELSNSPPIISGNLTFFAEFGEEVTYTYKVEDPDGDDISSFILKEPVPDRFNFALSGDTLDVTWTSPGLSLPTQPLQLFSNDTEGGITLRSISVVLCSCANNGSCLRNTSNLELAEFDGNNHYKWSCSCIEFFGGDSCEIDMRGCGEFSVCPETTVCRNESSMISGYVCDECMPGFEIMQTGEKCIDTDECNSSGGHNCSQVCVNTEGSYICSCNEGYRLHQDLRTCEDIDECRDGTSNCSQACNNSMGSFTCYCQQGFSLGSDNKTCVLTGTCSSTNICGNLSCTQISSSYECLCPTGQQCMGACNGTMNDISSGSQSCQACPTDMHGVRCSSMCQCGPYGTCDPEMGCVCQDGWTGQNCDIELNEFSPVFAVGTPSMPIVRWDLAEPSSPIATIIANDEDRGVNAGRVTYSLRRPTYLLPPGVSDGIGIFEIDPQTGQLTLNPSAGNLNSLSETFSEFVLRVQASDGGQPSRLADHTLTIKPIPVPVFQPGNRTVTFDEELTLGTSVFNLNCVEIGRPSGTLRLHLTGSGSSNFIIEESGSVTSLVVARHIDYEALSENEHIFDIIANCSNRFGLSDVITLRVEVNNIDDNVFAFGRMQYTALVSENASNGEVVLSVRAGDRDVPNADITYSIVSDVFGFIPNTNTIVVVGSLDRETRDEYLLNLTADYTAATGSTVRAFSSLKVNISDVNDVTPRFVPALYFVSNITTRAQMGDQVVTVSAIDSDLGLAGEVTFELEQNPAFSINLITGEIYVSSLLFPMTYKLSVRAEDSGINPLSVSTSVNIDVQPYLNSILLRLTDNPISVREDFPIGSQVGQLQTQVIDYSSVVLNDTSDLDISFSIQNETDIGLFVISSTTGEIFTLGTLDYDKAAEEYDLSLRAVARNDYSDISSDLILTIQVINIDDNPPQFMPQFYATVVEQFTPAGAFILTVSAMDPDQLASIEFSLSNTDVIPFEINSTTGEITASEELETAQDYRFRAIANDGGLVESTAAVFVSVTRSTSVAPTFTKIQFGFTLLENAEPGTYVGTATALARGNLSLDMFDHLGFRINVPDTIDFNVTNLPLTNASAGLFHIDESSGNISTQGSFEFDIESRRDFFFYVEVYNVNNGIVYDYATVLIELLDENDNAPQFSQSLYTRVINTSQPTDSVILVLSASDRDSGANGQVTYSMGLGESNVFLGFALNATSGAISVSNSTLLPGDYYLTIAATDEGMPSLEDEARVFIAILPTIPTEIEFTERPYTFEVAENAPPDTLVGTIRIVEVNRSLVLSNVTYSTPNVTDCFGVDASSGEIKLTCTTLDRDIISSYELEVEGRVSDTVATLGTVQISILDINDNSPEFILDVYTKVIDDRYGNETAVLQVVATDADLRENATVSYAIMPHSNPIFRVDSTSGEVFMINDTIEVGDYRLSVYATDMGTPRQSSSALVLICVTRAHPQTLEFQNNTFNIYENALRGTTVGTVVLVTNGGNEVNPGDFPDNLQFSIVGGDSPSNFSIDPDGGVVTSVTTFNREEASSHVIIILANFTQFNNIPLRHIQSSFMINILDVNEEPQVDRSLYEGTIDDSTMMGHVILNISATDYDTQLNALLNFSINPDPPSVFGVRVTGEHLPQTFGEIFVDDEDSLMPLIYRFNLIAIDSGNPPLLSTVAEVVIVVSYTIPEEIFFNTTNYLFQLLEDFGRNITGSIIVGNVSVLPETPALDPLVYNIIGGSGRNFFSVEPSSGRILKLHRNIDRERNTSFPLIISAHLPDHYPPLTAETMATITVDDLNDNAPVFNTVTKLYPTIGLDTDEIITSTSILTIFASDMDIGVNSEIVYGIESIEFTNRTMLTGPLPFMVDAQSGDVFPSFQGISVETYHIRFNATDRGIPSMSDRASVTVVVQQPAPNSIAFNESGGYTFTLEENRPTNTIATVQLQDIPNYLKQYLTFSTASLEFSVAQSSGVISSRRLVDYEVDKSFTFLVTARLDVSSRLPELHLITTVNVTVRIEDVNDNTPYFINFPPNITQDEERLTREVVRTIQANDSDSGLNARLVFEILNTDLDDIVSIDNNTGAISTAAGLDREDMRQGSTHNLMIRVCDLGAMIRCMQNTTVFNLLDINDNSPRLISEFIYYVDERRNSGRAFYFRATDPDEGRNGEITYNIANSSGRFWINSRNGGVNVISNLDFETIPLYNISLNLTDSGNPPRETIYRNITVVVNDLPDNTPQFSEDIYQANTDPTVVENDIIAQVIATDDDIPSSNDSLVYKITGIQETGNNGQVPVFRIDPITGEILSGTNQVFIPEAEFMVSVLVYDQSRFNLSNSVNVIINVIPDILAFTETEYTATVNEDTITGSFVITLPIQDLSVSSAIRYSVIAGVPFTTVGNGHPYVNITLFRDLDREVDDRWQVEVTARRNVPTRDEEVATTILIVTVGDVNDQRPMFTDAVGTVISISEDRTSQTYVTRANASDSDIGDNGRLRFSFENPPRDFPFNIDLYTGEVRTTGNLDYETTTSYNMTVLVRDNGVPVLDNRMLYTINIINVNDNFPQFSSPAYFGEVYARAPVNSFVKHTELTVFDPDDVNSRETLLFRVFQPQLQTQEDYLFRVTLNPPYRVLVVQITEVADTVPQLLELRVEVTDQGGKITSVPLFLSIFTSSNLVFYQLEGLNLNMLLSCQVQSSSMCAFREAVASITKQELGTTRAITFFNDTAEVSPVKPNAIIVGLYGWYGGLDSRDQRGELASSNRIPPVEYIVYDEDLFNQVAASERLFFLTFSVNLQEKETVTTPTMQVVPTSTLPINTFIGVGVVVVLAVLVVVLVIVLVCVFGRRRNNPKKKKNRRPSDPYERNINRLRQKHKKFGSNEDIPLHSTAQSDLAYETMYDDDDIVDTNQTMPWFDPKYLASGKDDYDGDTEQTISHPPGDAQGGPFSLRATVDGDARRGRRHSSEDSAAEQSVTELDPSDYLKGYQTSAPMKPGQRMAELDMFASRRTGTEPEKPYRPSLEHAQNQWQQQQPRPHPPLQPMPHRPSQPMPHPPSQPTSHPPSQPMPHPLSQPRPHPPSQPRPHQPSQPRPHQPNAPLQQQQPQYKQQPLRKLPARGAASRLQPRNNN